MTVAGLCSGSNAQPPSPRAFPMGYSDTALGPSYPLFGMLAPRAQQGAVGCVGHGGLAWAPLF